jgi:branched-subunit amino acid aminotransferase/4-amino-4-deoxychorismate lyase
MVERSPVAVWNGRALPMDQIGIPIWDASLVHGATVVEQLRTYAAAIPLLEYHLRRLRRGLQTLGLEQVDFQAIRDAVKTVVGQNVQGMAPHADLGLSIVISPGAMRNLIPDAIAHERSDEPTVLVYSFPLALAEWHGASVAGIRLATTKWRDIPASCLPKNFKHRSRLNYYLAQKEIAAQAPGCRPLLLTPDGAVAGAATAGLMAWIPGEGWITPPADIGLASITIEVLTELAEEAGVPVHRRRWSVDEFASASEVVWCSTPTGPLPVTEVDGRRIGSGEPGPRFETLERWWMTKVGMDYRGQISAAHRARSTLV